MPEGKEKQHTKLKKSQQAHVFTQTYMGSVDTIHVK